MKTTIRETIAAARAICAVFAAIDATTPAPAVSHTVTAPASPEHMPAAIADDLQSLAARVAHGVTTYIRSKSKSETSERTARILYHGVSADSARLRYHIVEGETCGESADLLQSAALAAWETGYTAARICPPTAEEDEKIFRASCLAVNRVMYGWQKANRVYAAATAETAANATPVDDGRHIRHRLTGETYLTISDAAAVKTVAAVCGLEGRQAEVCLYLAAGGWSQAEIADRLHVARSTIERDVSAIRSALLRAAAHDDALRRALMPAAPVAVDRRDVSADRAAALLRARRLYPIARRLPALRARLAYHDALRRAAREASPMTPSAPVIDSRRAMCDAIDAARDAARRAGDANLRRIADSLADARRAALADLHRRAGSDRAAAILARDAARLARGVETPVSADRAAALRAGMTARQADARQADARQADAGRAALRAHDAALLAAGRPDAAETAPAWAADVSADRRGIYAARAAASLDAQTAARRRFDYDAAARRAARA